MGVVFFQAEDGIRDIGVTGVQTCALPILPGGLGTSEASSAALLIALVNGMTGAVAAAATIIIRFCTLWFGVTLGLVADRKSVVSGKSVDLGGRRIIKKQHRL